MRCSQRETTRVTAAPYGYRFTSPPATARPPDFVFRSCSCRLFALVSCLETPNLAFSKRTLDIFVSLFLVVVTLWNFNRDKFLLWPHIFSFSLPSQFSYIYECVCVCVWVCIYKHFCICHHTHVIIYVLICMPIACPYYVCMCVYVCIYLWSLNSVN